ncbi:MAG: SPFH domain-containing protein [Paludibacteraceae bacterium]|nr:SPFH domain-containing protein [Paludibacteraceae bacterium]
MAIVDVVKSDFQSEELLYKYPSDDLCIGSQLVVYPSEVAFLVKGGTICDQFSDGTVTLKTDNIPILKKLVNLPFGNKTPFKAEVWYVNLNSKLGLKWGTPQPIQLEDPRYNIIVPVRSFGQYGIKVSNPRLFIESIASSFNSFDLDRINEFFKGRIISQLTSLITSKMTESKISVLEINSSLVEMSDYCQERLCPTFEKYGLGLVDFSFMSINVPENDPSVVQLKDAKNLAARLNITGKDFYQMDRSFDVLEKAASNNGVGGQMLSMGTGLGMGMGVGSTIGQMASQMMTVNNTPPPLPQSISYFVYVNGQQIGNQSINTISTLIQQGLVNGNTLVWYHGLPSWIELHKVPELAQLLNQQIVPPIPPSL